MLLYNVPRGVIETSATGNDFVFRCLTYRMQIQEMESTARYFAIRRRRFRAMLTNCLMDDTSFAVRSTHSAGIALVSIVAVQAVFFR